MKRKWGLGILGLIVVVAVFFALFEFGQRTGHQASTATHTQKISESSSSSIKHFKYASEEYAVMAVLDYNQTSGESTTKADFIFKQKSDHYEATNSPNLNAIKIVVNHQQVKLTDEGDQIHTYTITKLNQQLKAKQAQVNRLIKNGKKNDQANQSSVSSSSQDTDSAQSSSVDTHNLTNEQAIDWIWYYYNSTVNHIQSTAVPTGSDGEKMYCDNQYDGGLNPNDGLLYFRTQARSGNENSWWRINDQSYIQEGVGVDDNDGWHTVAKTYLSDK